MFYALFFSLPTARPPTKDSSSEGWRFLMTVRKTGALQEDIMIEIEVPVSLCFDSFWRVCRHSQHVASPPARSGRVATSQKHGGDKHKSLSRFPDLPSRPGGAGSHVHPSGDLHAARSRQGHPGRRQNYRSASQGGWRQQPNTSHPQCTR